MKRAACGILMMPALFSTLTWRERAPMPLPRAGYMAGLLGGKLVIAGGSYWKDNQKYWSDRTDYFDADRNAWESGPSLPSARGDAACVTVKDSMYTFGGGQGAPTAEVWRLHKNAWSHLDGSPLPEPRALAVAAELDGVVYLLGGLTKAGDYASATNRVWVWRPSASQSGWKEIPALPGPGRVSHAMAAANGKVYVFGGVTMDGSALHNLDDAYMYDPGSRTWSTLTALPVARRAWWAQTVRNRILILGGYTADFTAEILEFDPATGMASKTDSTLPHPLADAKFVLAGKRLLAAGGESGVKVRAVWTIEGNAAR
jgi:N-acetylneuraminic acid mutarotase